MHNTTDILEVGQLAQLAEMVNEYSPVGKHSNPRPQH
jgi:hypothetical protein